MPLTAMGEAVRRAGLGIKTRSSVLDALGCLLYIQIEIVNGQFDMRMHNYKRGHRKVLIIFKIMDWMRSLRRREYLERGPGTGPWTFKQ